MSTRHHVRSRLGAVALALGSLSPGVAAAQTPDEPLVQTEEAGILVTRLLVPAPAAEVRRFLDDPRAFNGLTPDVLSLDIRPSGACQELRSDTRGMLEPLHLATLRCPASGGWRETLIESESFTKYDAQMEIHPVAGGTQVVYRLAVGIDLPLPRLVISSNVRRSARLTMQALRDLFVRRAPQHAPVEGNGESP